LNIRDLKPGMSSVNIRVTVSKILKPKQIITGKGVEHEILEAKVERWNWRHNVGFVERKDSSPKGGRCSANRERFHDIL